MRFERGARANTMRGSGKGGLHFQLEMSFELVSRIDATGDTGELGRTTRLIRGSEPRATTRTREALSERDSVGIRVASFGK